jgi:uncharacterized membrane protein YgcG
VVLGARGRDTLMATSCVLRQECDKMMKKLFVAPLHLSPDGLRMAPLALLIAAGLFLFLTLILSLSADETRWIAMLTWALTALLLVGASWLWRRAIRRRTPEGRRLMDQLDGIRLALDEAPNAAAIGSVERLLPYAMALGVEKAWATKLEREIEVATRSGMAASGYSPAWLSPDYLGPSALAPPHALCRILDSALAPATERASGGWSSSGDGGGSSSSGSSGFSGGSSGGGGGGGGGGGW